MASEAIRTNVNASNPLCERLKDQFRNRGVNAPGLAASVPSKEVMRRVSAGLDPYGLPEAPVADMPISRRMGQGRVDESVRPMTGVRAGTARPLSAPVRGASIPAAKAEARPMTDRRPRINEATFRAEKIEPLAYVDNKTRVRSQTFADIRSHGYAMPGGKPVPGYARAYESAARVRSTAAQYYRNQQIQMEKAASSGVFAVPVLGKLLRVGSDAAVYAGEYIRKSALNHGIGMMSDERISSPKRRELPVGAIMLAVVFTVLLMVIVYSFSQVYETRSQIGELQAEENVLKQEVNAMALNLEIRDDILTVQNIATNKLGMISAGEAESRYVSVSGGERVEVAADAEASDEGILSGLLGNLKYYFR